MKTKFCPKCKGENIIMVAGGGIGLYECQDCKFRSAIFPEVEALLGVPSHDVPGTRTSDEVPSDEGKTKSEEVAPEGVPLEEGKNEPEAR